jgi:hypothetical protein
MLLSTCADCLWTSDRSWMYVSAQREAKTKHRAHRTVKIFTASSTDNAMAGDQPHRASAHISTRGAHTERTVGKNKRQSMRGQLDCRKPPKPHWVPRTARQAVAACPKPARIWASYQFLFSTAQSPGRANALATRPQRAGLRMLLIITAMVAGPRKIGRHGTLRFAIHFCLPTRASPCWWGRGGAAERADGRER